MNDPTSWQIPPHFPVLTTQEVQVWRVDLRAPDQDWHHLLSLEEQARAAKFSGEQRRSDFRTGRGVLRWLLGRYLNQDPRELQFSYGPQGKPDLEPPGQLRFNLAHAHGLALYAFAWNRAVGVDLEYLRSVRLERIVARCFAPVEIEFFQQLPDQAREPAFFNGWTRKEAYLKALGRGLTVPLSQCPVSLDEPARFLDPDLAAQWSLLTLNPGPGYIGALVVQGQLPECTQWQWQPGIA
ncbi:4'-phosphopantetheinyl transferase superfamily protein [Candidatus Cyanaurora vandensis]|uniref:4'-phosphopantetheinyl transferase family protein n=1 Tax=Candidatus Cyanaurora vandensis TaxID=2714958 RepID=UPI002579ACA6|nr:4'-phosphopantetheinyl transferase superfamily protein [Candidatus Cyanaurora vandensis]